MTRDLRIAVCFLLLTAVDSTEAPKSLPIIQSPSGPLALWGVHLRARLDPAVTPISHCMSAQEFAHLGGQYSPIADAVLMGAPHQHRDSAMVLRGLAPARVCYAHATSTATVIATLIGDTVANAIFFWPRPQEPPSLDSVSRILTKLYGPPKLNEFGTPVWSRDSTGIYLAPQGPYWRGTTITLSDWRVCVRYERYVHRYEPLVGQPTDSTNTCQ